MKPFNCVEIIAILVYKQIRCNLSKNKITNKLISYISCMPNVCKQMTDAKLLLLHSNTLNHLTLCEKK